MVNKIVRARIFGRVQGVWFRECTRQRASDLSLAGWVRNRPDGSVEALISGSPAAVDELIDWLHTGPPRSEVLRVEIEDLEDDASLSTFTIIS